MTLGILLLTLGWEGRHNNGAGVMFVSLLLAFVFRLLTFADVAMISIMPSCIVCSVYLPFVDLCFYDCD